MKCFHIVIGISPVWGDTVELLPRLPKGWSVAVKDYPLVNTRATADMETAYPVGNTQSMTLHLNGDCGAQALRIRFGPFSKETDNAAVTLNGRTYTIPTEISGDAGWVWLTVKVDSL
jgi:hypothetical protein